jgi:hypothetical protein
MKYIDATKGTKGVHGKYADMLSVAKALEKENVEWRQRISKEEGELFIETSVKFNNGDGEEKQWSEYGWPVPIIFAEGTSQQRGMQALGSAITYARRYSLQVAANVIPTDDDGEDAIAGYNGQNRSFGRGNGNYQRNNQQAGNWRNRVTNNAPTEKMITKEQLDNLTERAKTIGVTSDMLYKEAVKVHGSEFKRWGDTITDSEFQTISLALAQLEQQAQSGEESQESETPYQNA